MNIFKGKYVQFGDKDGQNSEEIESSNQFLSFKPNGEGFTNKQNKNFEDQVSIPAELSFPQTSVATNLYEKIASLEKERALLYQEILKLKTAEDQLYYDEKNLNKNQTMQDTFIDEVNVSLSGANQLNNTYSELQEKLTKEKDSLRELYHTKQGNVEEVVYTHKQKIDKMVEEHTNSSKNKTGFLEVFKDQIYQVIQRITQCEEYLDNQSKKEIEKVKMFIQNRKKAEESFCLERKKYAETIDNIQRAFDMKWESKRAEIMREFKMVVDENAKLKDENKHLLEENMFIQDNLESLKKISSKREEELLHEIKNMKQFKLKSADELLTIRKKTNRVLDEKLYDIQKTIDDINFGEVNKKVYDDYTKDLELLNERIFLLEKKIKKEHIHEKKGKTKADLQDFLNIMNKIAQKMEQITNGRTGQSLTNLEKFLESLAKFYSKQNDFENAVNHFNGFLEFFNDLWNKFQLKVNEQNSMINRLERQKLIEAQDKLKTPRDVAYEMEIKKREEIISQLQMEQEVSKSTITSLIEKCEKEEQYNDRSSPYVEALVRENAQQQTMKEKAESSIYAIHQNFNDKLKQLANDYQAMASSLEKFDDFVHHSFEIESAHLEMSKISNETLKSINLAIKDSLNLNVFGKDQDAMTSVEIDQLKQEMVQIKYVREDYDIQSKELYKARETVLKNISTSSVADQSILIHTQMQLMNSLPELQAKGVHHIYYRVQSILQEIEQSKHTLNNENESLNYMKDLITTTEDESKRKELLYQEDMILLQKKCKETLDLMQKKIDMHENKSVNLKSNLDQMKRENEKVQKDSDKIIENTKTSLGELLEIMNNHFKIVANDTKLLDNIKGLTDNLPDVRVLCQKFMQDQEKKVTEDTIFIENLVTNSEAKCKILQECDKESFDIMKKDLTLMKNEVKTQHEVIMKIKGIFDGQCAPVSNFQEETMKIKQTQFKQLEDSKEKLSNEIHRYRELNSLRLKTMNIPQFEDTTLRA